MDDLTRRVGALETAHADLRLQQARADERAKNVDDNVAEIRDSLKWLVRLVLTGIIGAAMTLLLSGGLPV